MEPHPGPGSINEALRRLPKVDDVLASEPLRELLARAPRWAVLSAVRAEIERLRARLLKDPKIPVEVDPRAVEREVNVLLHPSLVPVLNATGVVLHTNLGRAPLAERALDRIVQVSRGYANLEYKLDERRRGSRHDHVRTLIQQLTGAEDALVVNNCAAAVLLALAAHAQGRAAIVSRGELVEIGGSFRVPDVMRASGVRLVEVGTTNRTHLHDYERALDENADVAMLLKVHRSNFAVIGFTHEVAAGELAELARARAVRSMIDLGSGAMVDLRRLGLDVRDEPPVTELVKSGVELITFSGDKLLGGPQAGLLVGSSAAIGACKTHPLLRAVRPSKLALAGLEASLELYRDGRAAEIPALAMLSTPEPTLEARAQRLRDACAKAAPRIAFEAVRVKSAVGGGALPLTEPWSWAVAATDPQRSPDQLDAVLRGADPPVIVRISDDRLLLDVRTLTDADVEAVARAFGLAYDQTGATS